MLVAGAILTRWAGLSVDTIRSAVGSGDVTAALAFVGIYAALTVAMFPASVVTLAGGALFGAVTGAVLTVAGATVGATAAFVIGRRLSRASVEAIAGQRLRDLDRRLEHRGFVTVLTLRLVPLVPFNVLNYAAGSTALRARHYVAGTAIGIIPGSIAFAAAGAAAGEPSSPVFVVAVAGLAILTLGGAVAARRMSQQGSPG